MARDFEPRNRKRPSLNEEVHILFESRSEEGTVYPIMREDEERPTAFYDTASADSTETSDLSGYGLLGWECFEDMRIMDPAQQDCIWTEGVYISEELREHLGDKGIHVTVEGNCISEQLRKQLGDNGIHVNADGVCISDTLRDSLIGRGIQASDYEVLVGTIETDRDIKLVGDKAFMIGEEERFFSGKYLGMICIMPVEMSYGSLPLKKLSEMEVIVNGAYKG
jgi:hypothetical protein